MSIGKLQLCPECRKLGISQTISRKHCRYCGWEKKAEYDDSNKDVAFDFGVNSARPFQERIARDGNLLIFGKARREV